MDDSTKSLIDTMFAAVTAKDLDAALACLSDDAVLFDPHYPSPRMEGKEAIADGLRWGFAGITSFGFDIDRYFGSDDGRSAVIEVSTHHVVGKGNRLDFPQVFVVDTDGSHITRLVAFEPYGPHGMAGFGLSIGHLLHRLKGRRAGAKAA